MYDVTMPFSVTVTTEEVIDTELVDSEGLLLAPLVSGTGVPEAPESVEGVPNGAVCESTMMVEIAEPEKEKDDDADESDDSRDEEEANEEAEEETNDGAEEETKEADGAETEEVSEEITDDTDAPDGSADAGKVVESVSVVESDPELEPLALGIAPHD